MKGSGTVDLQVILNHSHDYAIVKIFTTAFRKVYESRKNYLSAGKTDFNLDTSRFQGSVAADGLYYVVVTTPTNRWLLKLLILR
jgi:hypothetical protein